MPPEPPKGWVCLLPGTPPLAGDIYWQPNMASWSDQMKPGLFADPWPYHSHPHVARMVTNQVMIEECS